MAILKINGREKHFGDGQMPATLMELLDHMQIHHATVVAEINGEVIERNKFTQTPLAEGQTIELVRFVGGG